MDNLVEQRMASIEDRLDRIDMKLDILVRLEERQVNSDEALRRMFSRVEVLEGRVREMEIHSSSETVKTSANTGAISMAIGFVCTIVSALVVWQIKG